MANFSSFDDGLSPFVVFLYEDGVKLIFECWAEDEAHAFDQAEDAYPGCELIEAKQNTDYIATGVKAMSRDSFVGRFHIYEIKWDVDYDDDLNTLPKQIVVDIDKETLGDMDIKEYLAEFLTENYDFCHDGFRYQELNQD